MGLLRAERNKVNSILKLSFGLIVVLMMLVVLGGGAAINALFGTSHEVLTEECIDGVTLRTIQYDNFEYLSYQIIDHNNQISPYSEIALIQHKNGTTIYYSDNLGQWVEVYKRNDGNSSVLIDNCAITGDAQLALLEKCKKYFKL